jgi:ribonuclease-3
LEFLGDAVLGLVVAAALYARFPALTEGSLTELRSYLVKGETLGAVAQRLGLGAHLLLGRGEEATGGRARPQNLARVFEAVTGAIFLDAGFAAAETWLLGVLRPELDSLAGGEAPADAKSRLQHTAQLLFASPPRYEVVAAEGPDHEKHFTVSVSLGGAVLAQGEGRSKRLAEREAAEAALAALAARAATPDEAARG